MVLGIATRTNYAPPIGITILLPIVHQQSAFAWFVQDLRFYRFCSTHFDWCWDIYDSAIYQYRANLTEPIIDPTGEEGNNTFGDLRVRRGGNFNSVNEKLRVYSRDDGPADSVSRGVGFRLVRTVGVE